MKTTPKHTVIKTDGDYVYSIAPAKFREGKFKIFVTDKDGNTANLSCFVYPKDEAISICRKSANGKINE